MNILVVGCGIFGLSTALECIRRGMDVVLADAGAIPCVSASSHDAHRLIRHPYGPLRGYARLVPAAYSCWEELWDEVGDTLYMETGTLAIGDPVTGWIEQSVESLEELGIQYDRLSPAAARERFNHLSIREGKQVLFTPSGGVLLADRILTAAALRLRDAGARLLPHTLVSPGNLSQLAADTRADVVVITTGVGTSLPSAFVSYGVTPTRQVVGYLPTPPSELVSTGPGTSPMILDLDETSGCYLIPSVSGTPAKIGDHLPGRADDDEYPGPPTSDERQRLSRLYERARDRPIPDSVVFSLCRYAMTEDRRFVLRESRYPYRPPGLRVLVAGGGSGHGFKFGPLIGKLAADVIDRSLDITDGERIAAGFVERLYRR